MYGTLGIFSVKGCFVFTKYWTRDAHQQWTEAEQNMPEIEKQNTELSKK